VTHLILRRKVRLIARSAQHILRGIISRHTGCWSKPTTLSCSTNRQVRPGRQPADPNAPRTQHLRPMHRSVDETVEILILSFRLASFKGRRIAESPQLQLDFCKVLSPPLREDDELCCWAI